MNVCLAASVCSDPQLSSIQHVVILLVPSPADPHAEEREKRCFALPQHASEQPSAVGKHKMQALDSALLMILFLLCQDGKMRSC